MVMTKQLEIERIEQLLVNELLPIACTVDEEGLYPREVMQALGREEAYQLSKVENPTKKRLELIELTAKYCVSTSFLVWCQTTAISFINGSSNEFLRQSLLPKLESGEILAGTALSNPMKYYAGMEDIRLKAVPTEGGYVINGVTPFVSNVGANHWFGLIAEVSADQRILAMVDCDSDGMYLKEHKDFTGMNGTSSYTCRFKNVFIPTQQVVSHHADEFIQKIRADFVLSQTGMGLGLTQASIDNMTKVLNKQNDTNQYLSITPQQLQQQLDHLREQSYQLSEQTQISFKEAVEIRLQAAELSLQAAELAVLYQGAAGYFKKSDCMRRLREALFVAIVTPAIKHLKRMLIST